MNPVITLPELAGGEAYCPDVDYELTGQCVGTPSRVEWSSEGLTAGAELTISSTDTDATTVSGNVNGDYPIKFCCYYDTAPEAHPDLPQGPFLNCPYSAESDSNFEIRLLDAEDYATCTWTVAGESFYFDYNDYVLIRTKPAIGLITVSVSCDDGQGNITTADCQIIVRDPLVELNIIESEPVCFTAIDCSEECFCTTSVLTLNCQEPECFELCIDINATLPVEPIALEECEPAVEVPLVGLKSVFEAYPVDYECQACDEWAYTATNPDHPNFIWNDCAQCPNWTVQGEAANASDCVAGNPWCFTGSDTYTVQSGDGSKCSVDVIVIYGHNIEQAVISASVPIFGGDREYTICTDRAKIGGFTRPIIVPLDGLFEGTGFSFTVTGTGINNQPICIDYAMFGQKLFLPDDLLPSEFVNPLDGCDREFTVKNSECGVISRTSKQKPVTWSITIEAPDLWICDTWRSYMRYLGAGNPAIFQPSRNNKEQDVLLGYKSGQQEGSSYVDCGWSSVTLSVEGFLQQPQPKSFAA